MLSKILKETVLNKTTLIPGMVIRSNYSPRRYKIIQVNRGCKCARPSDELGYTKSGMKKESPEHIHIYCKDIQDNMNSYFNGFVELDNGVKSIWNTEAEIFIISFPKHHQYELF